MDLSIIVPAHNEEDNIAQVIKKIESTVTISHELIIVNDHSADKTALIVSELISDYPNLRLIENPLDGSFANAIRTGLANIKTNLVVSVMGDLCDDLGTIALMLEKIKTGYDVVCGARYIKGGARIGGSRVKGFFSFLVGRTISMFTKIPTRDIANAFKMYRRGVIESIDIESTGFEISMELTLKAYFNGFKIIEVPTVWREREQGKSNFKMFDLTANYSRWYLWAIKKKMKGAWKCKNSLK